MKSKKKKKRKKRIAEQIKIISKMVDSDPTNQNVNSRNSSIRQKLSKWKKE